MPDQDNQLRQLQIIFIEEAAQILTEAEESLLELEAEGFKEDLINKIFRLAHNFKGSSRSVGFKDLSDLAHKYEDVLTLIKNHTIDLTPELISALLTSNDVLKKGILLLSENQETVINVQEDIKNLALFLKKEKHSQKENKAFGFFDEEDEHTEIKDSEKKNTKEPSETKDKSQKSSEDALKISSKRLDDLLNIIGEMVVNQSILDDCKQKEQTDSPIALQAISYMSKLISDAQNLSLSMRFVPIKPLFQKLRRTARDLSSSLNKKINLIEKGVDSELEKNILDKIADPLNHMIRNAIDHGIESEEERKTSNKNEVANITLEAINQDERIKIIIADDGKGLNKDKIRLKALQVGLIKDTDNLSESEIFNLIFAPGFSTKEKVTDVSGRGVGMEVVKKAIEELKGSIQITSELNKGTSFEIFLPLSFSIIGGMVIRVCEENFVVPMSQLLETIEMSKHSIHTVTAKGRMIDLRGEVIPVINLSNALSFCLWSPKTEKKSKYQQSKTGLITYIKNKKIIFEVEEIIAQQKIVLKKLGKEFEKVPAIMAGTILSNGEPGLVLNLEHLAYT